MEPVKEPDLKNPNLLLHMKLRLHWLRPLHLQPLRQLLQKSLNYFDNSEHPHPDPPLHQRRPKQNKDGVSSSAKNIELSDLDYSLQQELQASEQAR